MSLVLVEDLQWDQNRVVHGEDDNKVVPLLYESAVAREQEQVSLRWHHLLLLLLVVTCTTLAGFSAFLRSLHID